MLQINWEFDTESVQNNTSGTGLGEVQTSDKCSKSDLNYQLSYFKIQKKILQYTGTSY